MKGGFPDYHQFPDRDHGDESFWPSFTDIMMVITMVFLLVTVMAITNNWKLVTDLKTSIQAERLAAEQALDKEAQNNSLEDQMIMLQKRLVDASKVSVDKQVANEALQKELTRILAKVSTIEKELDETLKKVKEREKQLSLSGQQVDSLRTDRDKQLATLEARAVALANLQSIQETSQQQVIRLQAALNEKQAALIDTTDSSKAKIIELENALANANLALTNSEKSNDARLANLQERFSQLELMSQQGQGALKERELKLQQAQDVLRERELTLQQAQDALKEKDLALQQTQATLKETEVTLDSSRESQQLSAQQLETLRSEVSSLETTRRQEAAALESLRSEMAELQDLRSEDIVKLQSLKNEYDSLDTEYQKLVRPARSSEGKHVVSVWYSKKTGRDVYRIRDGSSGSFDTTTRAAMKNTLAALKDKHGKELYVKVIIPENSGLSYSDAWRFTTEMQRAFDYYYQENDE